MSNSKSKVRLRINSDDPSARVQLFNASLHEIPLPNDLGNFEVKVEPGVYAVHFERGGSVTKKTVIVKPGQNDCLVNLTIEEAPYFAAASPVEGTYTSREYHQQAARTVSLQDPHSLVLNKDSGVEAYLMVFIRNLNQETELRGVFDLTLHNEEGRFLFDIVQNAKSSNAGWLGINLALTPGAYRLRYTGQTSFVEQIVYVLEQWQTQFFMLTSLTEERPIQMESEKLKISIFMTRKYEGFEPHRPDMVLTESALQALSKGQSIPGRESKNLLRQKFDNPMLGIYGALLYLRRKSINEDLVKKVFWNLHRLVGPIPDILAIGWALAMRSRNQLNNHRFMKLLRNSEHLSMPPMLMESWRHLTLATSHDFNLIKADSLSSRVGVNILTSGPWLMWKGEPPVLEKPKVRIQPKAGFIKWIGTAKHFLSEISLNILLPQLNNSIEKIPDVGYRLKSSKFSYSERVVAKYLSPKADPVLIQLLSHPELNSSSSLKEMGRRITKSTPKDLIRILGAPAPTVISVVWGLYRKLVLEAIPPLEYQLKNFASLENQKSERLRNLLLDLMNIETNLIHDLSGNPLNLLQLLYLRYRGKPGLYIRSKVTYKDVIQLLTEAGYRTKKRKTINEDDISHNIANAQSWLIKRIEQQKFIGHTLQKNWQQRVFCHPEDYQAGGLLRGIFIEKIDLNKIQETGELSLLAGLGPKTRVFLQSEGVESLDQILELGQNDVYQLEAKNPGFVARWERNDWQSQAKFYIRAIELAKRKQHGSF